MILFFFFNIFFVSSHMYPENPEETQVIVGSMNMGYISDTDRNRTHNLFRTKREPIQIGHSDGLQKQKENNLENIRFSNLNFKIQYFHLKYPSWILLKVSADIHLKIAVVSNILANISGGQTDYLPWVFTLMEKLIHTIMHLQNQVISMTRHRTMCRLIFHHLIRALKKLLIFQDFKMNAEKN